MIVCTHILDRGKRDGQQCGRKYATLSGLVFHSMEYHGTSAVSFIVDHPNPLAPSIIPSVLATENAGVAGESEAPPTDDNAHREEAGVVSEGEQEATDATPE